MTFAQASLNATVKSSRISPTTPRVSGHNLSGCQAIGALAVSRGNLNVIWSPRPFIPAGKCSLTIRG